MRAVRRLRLGTRRAYGWGLADSAFASAANLALSLLAGRILGPHGLGILVVGFSLYLLMVSVQRSLVSTPLVSGSTRLEDDERKHATRSALAVLIATGVVVTAGVLCIGVAIGGAIGRGLLVFAPWLVPSILQDFWRAILFRDGRPAAAAANTSLRLVGMAVTAPLAVLARTDFAIAASWGAGFALAAGVGFAQTRVFPVRFAAALRWWRARAWPFGKWLVAQEGVFNVMSYAITFALIGILGAAALGGLRAAETVFAPFSLLAPAIALPGLPAVARALGRDVAAARQLALRLSLAAVVLTVLYFGTMLLVGRPLLEALYGADFGPYADLIVPIGTWQVVTAVAIGFTLFLSAAQRGRAILVAGLVGSVGQFVLMTLLAWTSGLRGAAWGLAAGTAAGSATAVALVQLSRRGAA